MAVGTTKVVIATLIGNAAIAVTKFAAAAFTGSSAMFAEAVHSVVDILNQLLLLLSIRQLGRPADGTHPFGYGKEIYFWAFAVAILLFGMGAGISIWEGVIKIKNPETISNAYVNYTVIALAMAFKIGAWTLAYRAFDKERGKTPLLRAVRASKDPALFTVLFEDSAAMLGLLAALAGVFLSDHFGLHRADGAASVVIGGILASAAVLLAIETKSLLIGEAASDELLESVIGMTGQAGFVEAVNEVRTMHFGPADVLVNISVDARNSLMANEIETEVSVLEARIKAAHPAVSRVFIEIQAARDSAVQIAPDDTGSAQPA